MVSKWSCFNAHRSRFPTEPSVFRKAILPAFVALSLLATPFASVVPVTTAKAAEKPNIILILTDDQNIDTMRFMPQTKRLLGRQGVRFTQYYDNISLCCAARASLLRGQYAQNTGVFDNQLPNGGFLKYYQTGLYKNDLGVWLRRSGYTTSFMGKYLNDYPAPKGGGKGVAKTWVPNGWNDWFVPVDGSPYFQYNYVMNDNKKLVRYGNKASDYMTDVIKKRAVNYIKNHENSSKPYFMYIAPYSPHAPYTPPARYKNSFSNLTYPQNDAFNEADVSDKPGSVANKQRLRGSSIEQINAIYRKQAGAVKGVDDLVGEVYRALKNTGQLDNTYIIFTSDNGYHLGEHRLSPGKYSPYQPDVNIPLYMRGPGIAPGRVSNALVGNVDLAPTIMQFAGSKAPGFVDGMSIASVARNASSSSGRQYYLLQRNPSNFRGSDNFGTNEPADETSRDLPYKTANAFGGLVSKDRYKYIRYGNGFEEFYDLRRDPHELDNLARDPSAMSSVQRSRFEVMRKSLGSMNQCRASTCRR